MDLLLRLAEKFGVDGGEEVLALLERGLPGGTGFRLPLPNPLKEFIRLGGTGRQRGLGIGHLFNSNRGFLI